MSKFISLIRQRQDDDGKWLEIFDVVSPDGNIVFTGSFSKCLSEREKYDHLLKTKELSFDF